MTGTQAKNLASLALLLVKLAEYSFTGTKRGAEKKAQVFSWLYEVLPDNIAEKIPRDDLEIYVERAVAEMKRGLEMAAQ